MHRVRDAVLVTVIALAVVLSDPLAAQNCKPDASTKDKITKVQIDEWAQSLYQTGILASALTSSSEVNITGSISRVGDVTFMNIILAKQESNVARAVLESQYHAEKGNQFLFGFKEGGTPLTFTADQVSNNTSADIFGKLNTRVILSAIIKDENLRAFRDSIAGRHIDAVRVSVATAIEKSVGDKTGKQFGEKLACFFTFAEQKGFLK